MNELKRLTPYLKRYRKLLLWGLCFVTLSNVCSAIYPRIIGSAVDIMKNGSYETSDIINRIVEILLLTAGSGFFMFLTRKTIIVASRKVEYDIRNDLLLAIEKQSMSYYTQTPTGVLMAHATNDVAAVREFLGPAIMYSANTLTTFVFALSMMLQLHGSLTLVALIPLPFVAMSTFFIGKKVHIAYKNVQQQYEVLTTQAQEVFSGIRIVRAFVREQHEQGIFAGHSQTYIKQNLRLASLQSLTMPLMMVLVGCSQLLVLGYGGMLVIKQQATLGVIAQFFIYLNQLIFPIAAIGWVTNIVQRAAASTARLGVIFDKVPDIRTPEQGKPFHHGDILFNKVHFSYSSSARPVLQEISLRIPKGSSLGIVGMVGSGKSTVTRLLPRLYDVSSGSLTINGTDVRDIEVASLRQHIGIIPQEAFLFSMSLADNIRIGKTDATMEEIITAARRAQLHDDIVAFPQQYETVIGERGISLSGGQKQRLAIARALVRNPDILILDDSLNAVDTATESAILGSLREVMQNRTTIVIAHRISAVQQCSNIIVLENGSIIEQGTHFELLALNAKYADMYQRQLLESEIL